MQVAGAQRHDVSIDEALSHGVGEFGRGQLFIILQVRLALGNLSLSSDPGATLDLRRQEALSKTA